MSDTVPITPRHIEHNYGGQHPEWGANTGGWPGPQAANQLAHGPPPPADNGIMTSLMDNKLIVFLIAGIIILIGIIAYLLLKDDKPKETMAPTAQKTPSAQQPPPAQAAQAAPAAPAARRSPTQAELAASLARGQRAQAANKPEPEAAAPQENPSATDDEINQLLEPSSEQ